MSHRGHRLRLPLTVSAVGGGGGGGGDTARYQLSASTAHRKADVSPLTSAVTCLMEASCRKEPPGASGSSTTHVKQI